MPRQKGLEFDEELGKSDLPFYFIYRINLKFLEPVGDFELN